MHSTTCGIGASTSNSTPSMQSADGLKMGLSNNDDAMNKIPLKSVTDDEEKNGGEFIHDTATAEEARREQRRVKLLNLMKKLTIGIICFIGIALISYVIISLCFSDDKSHNDGLNTATSTSLLESNSSNSGSNSSYLNQTQTASIVGTATTETIVPQPPQHIAIAADTIASLDELTTGDAATISSLDDTNTTTDATVSDNKPSMTFKDTLIVNKNFTSKLGVYEHAAVCSDKSICSQIGSNILQEGGSAVDSAIAALLCNGIVTMHSMGIGGGMLMNIFIKDQNQAYSVDGREVAPFAATDERYTDVDNTSLLHGPLAIAVPGELMGYHRAHEQFGNLPWKQLVEPSLQICKDGFYITKHQYNAMGYKDRHMRNNTILRKMFYNETTNTLHPEGTKIMPAEELCNTYKLLAENGPLDFYNGTLAKLVAEDLRELGSIVDYADLETYRADLVNSVTMRLGDDILYAVPPTSSGTIIANVLSILEGFNMTRADLADVKHEATTMHRIAEALKFGFAKRWELGDVRFNDVRELVSRLTNPETGHQQRLLINDSSVLKGPHEYGGQFSGEDDVGTSALVVMAPNGDTVSVTSSVNDYFGSGLAGKRTGIVFNSAMNDFSLPGSPNQFALPPSPTNFIDAQKRPMSSMSPMILADNEGNVKMAISAAGGSKIISAIVEVMVRVLWMNDNIKDAIDAPRYHHQLIPDVLEYEKNGHFTEELLKLLSAKGQHVKSYNYTGSVVCGIVKNDTAIYANADYRKQGDTVGY